jgi:hypothetical protein
MKNIYYKNIVNLYKTILNSFIYFYWLDGVIKKLYIKTPFMNIIRNTEKGLIIDVTNENFYDNLKDKIKEISKLDQTKISVYNDNKLHICLNEKTEIIKHNISNKYPKTEILKDDIFNTIKNIHISNNMEAMFIFSPRIYKDNIFLIAYKIEIKYKKQHIKSYLQSKEIDIDYIDKFKKIVVEL